MHFNEYPEFILGKGSIEAPEYLDERHFLTCTTNPMFVCQCIEQAIWPECSIPIPDDLKNIKYLPPNEDYYVASPEGRFETTDDGQLIWYTNLGWALCSWKFFEEQPSSEELEEIMIYITEDLNIKKSQGY